MYIPNPYFKNIPQIGDLTLDFIFVEDGYPILFVCAKENRLFLCLCRTLTPKQKWVLSEIKLVDLEKMIKNKICIKDAFKSYSEGKSCIVKWDKTFAAETYEVIPTSCLPITELPDEDVFLDNDDENAYIYFEQLKNRIQNMAEKSVYMEPEFSDNVITTVKSFIEVSVLEQNTFTTQCNMKNLKFGTASDVLYTVEEQVVDKSTMIFENTQTAIDNVAPAA